MNNEGSCIKDRGLKHEQDTVLKSTIRYSSVFCLLYLAFLVIRHESYKKYYYQTASYPQVPSVKQHPYPRCFNIILAIIGEDKEYRQNEQMRFFNFSFLIHKSSCDQPKKYSYESSQHYFGIFYKTRNSIA